MRDRVPNRNFRRQPRSDSPYADKIGLYGDLSYVLLVAPVALIFWLGNEADLLVRDLVEGKPKLQFVAEIVFEAIPLPTNYEFELSLLELVVIAYILLGIKANVRRRVGEVFVDWSAWILHRLIEIAEWCLGNRWWSIAFLIVLCGTLTMSLHDYKEDISLEIEIRSGYKNWLGVSENFLMESPLYGRDGDRFGRQLRAWDPRFKRILDSSEFKLASNFQQMMILLSDPKDRQWIDHLSHVEPMLLGEYKKASETPVRTDGGNYIFGMIRLLIGMVHVRLGEDDCSSIENVIEASEFLSDTSISCCNSAVLNWRGNIYNCAHKFMVENLVRRPDPKNKRSVQRICSSQLDCLDKAIKAYQGAANGADKCSPQVRRRINNILDLKTKLALSYQAVALQSRPVPSLPIWLRTPEALAAEIETAARELQRCNEVGVEPLAFVTTSQAFGAAASLRPAGSSERALDLRNAGAFMRLAISYLPRDLPNWNLEYFCPTLVDGSLPADLVSGLDQVAGLPEVDREFLQGHIQRQCQ